jgi:hypothetical protein
MSHLYDRSEETLQGELAYLDHLYQTIFTEEGELKISSSEAQKLMSFVAN